MGVAGVGAFDVDRARVHVQHVIDDVGQRNVEMMRGAGVAPAHVEPNPIGRNPVERAVQCLDRQREMVVPVPDA